MIRLARAIISLLPLVVAAGVAPTTALARLSPFTAQAAEAQEQCADLEHGLPAGANLVILACLDGVENRPQYMALEQVRLPVGESVPVQQTYYEVLLYVEAGEVVVFDAESGRESTVGQGSQEFLSPRSNGGPGVSYGLRNDGVEEVILLELTYTPGVAAETTNITYPYLGTAQSGELFRGVLSQFFAEVVDRVFLARVTLEPGVDLGFHSHPGPVAMAVESGTLGVELRFPEMLASDSEHWIDRAGPPVPSGEATTMTVGQFAVLPERMPHREWNDGGAPVSYLLAGIVRAADPFMGDDSSLEVHSALCPAGYTGGNHYRDCHNRGRAQIWLILRGDDGYRAEAMTLEPGEGQGPGQASFRRLTPGRYHLAEQTAEPRDAVSIFCSADGGETALALHVGFAIDGIDIDMPPSRHVVCDWYTIPPG